MTAKTDTAVAEAVQGVKAASRSGPGTFGWLLVIFRLIVLVMLLAAVVPCLYFTRIFASRRIWPKIYFRLFCPIIGLKVTVRGKSSPNTLLLPNHVSWMDIPALLGTTGSAFVAHDGLSAIGPLRWLCDFNDTVFIARHRRSKVSRQVEQVREALDDGGSLTVFLEGTTSDGTHVRPFKSALLSAIEPLPEGLSIQPVWLDYANSAKIAWIGNEPGLDNFLFILSRIRPVRLTIHLLDPLPESDLANRKSVTLAAHEAIEKAMAQSRDRP